MENPLEGMERKLGRSADHINAFYGLSQDFFKTNFYRTRGEQDSEGRLVEVVTEVDPMPPDWGLFIGDAAHNLRSVLDHVMWLLAKPVTEEEAKRVQFPLYSDPDRYIEDAKRIERMMPGVPPGVEAIVESLQPYNSGQWPETALLGQIQAIDNWDKHRTLLVTATNSEIARLTTTITGNASLVAEERFAGELKPGAILARVEIANPSRGDKVHMETEATFVPVFDSRMPEQIRGRPILKLFGDAGQFIQGEVIPKFFRFLFAGATITTVISHQESPPPPL